MFRKTILFDLDGVLNTYDGKYDKNITFIQIPSYIPQKNNEYNRIITIRDNYNAGYSYDFQKNNKSLIKNKKQGNN